MLFHNTLVDSHNTMAYTQNANALNSSFDSQLPLYIPRLFEEHADESYIAMCFHSLGLGDVKRVDLNPKQDQQNGTTYYEAFIHFNRWYGTQQAYQLQYDIADAGTIARVWHGTRYVWDYNQQMWVQKPVFWIVNRCTNPESEKERELKQVIQQLHDEFDFHEEEHLETERKKDDLIQELYALIEQQAAELKLLRPKDNEVYTMDSTSVSDQIPIDVQEFDPLLLTPDNEDDLPKSGHELAAQYPDGPISDFYKEVGNGLSDEWLSLSDEEKRERLDAEMENLQQDSSELELERVASSVAGMVIHSDGSVNNETNTSFSNSRVSNDWVTEQCMDTIPSYQYPWTEWMGPMDH